MIVWIADRLTALAVSHRRAIFWSVLGLSALSILAASRLHFNPDILRLVPQNNRVVNDFRRVLGKMGTIDQHLVVLQIPPGRQVEDYEGLIDSLAQRYRALPTVADVEYRLPNPLTMMDEILPRALLLLTPAELDRVAAALTDEQIERAVAENRQTLRTPQGVAARELVENDPFHLLPIFLDKFQAARGGFKLAASSGYFLSADRTTLLILVQPRRPAQDIPFGRRFMAQARQVERAALADFRRESGGQVPPPGIGYTGGYAVAVYDAGLIQKDVVVNIVFSCLGVLVLFLYAFRRPAALLYAGLPMALAVLGTFGLAGLVAPELSSASATFGALVVGLGVDFITVLYGRYVAERSRGAEPAAAIRDVYRTTLPGVFFAAITTAATFYSYLFTQFRGMSELGVLTGTGILIFLVCVLFLLPALLLATDRGGAAGNLELRSFGSERLVRWALARPGATIVAWGVLLAACAVMIPGLRFSDNVENLRAKGNQGVAFEELVTRKFGQSFGFMMYAIEGQDLETVLEKTQWANQELAKHVDSGPLASFQSIATFLPPRAQQMEILARLRTGRKDVFSNERIAATLRRGLATNGFRPGAFDRYLALFARALSPPEPVGPADFHDESLAALTRRYLKRTDDGYISVIYLYPKGGSWGRNIPQDLVALAARQPGATLTGVNRLTTVLRAIVREDAARSTLLGFAVVFAVFWIAYRSLKRATLLFVPFLAGAIGMLGLMSLCGLEFNFINVYVGLFLVGVATDYGLYMLQRYLEDPAAFPAGAPETGRAVVMAALTCVVGFGSFALSHYPGLRSIGYACTFGVTMSGLATITLLPALLSVSTRGTRIPGPT